MNARRRAALPAGAAGDARDSVYPAREDTLLLRPFARSAAPESRWLEIGTGNGVLALEAGRRGARVVATDLNPIALQRLRGDAARERLSVDCVRTDLAQGLGRFDGILANPPYLPTTVAERDRDRWHNLATDGGPDGLRTAARIVRSLPRHLRRGGVAYVLFSSLQDGRRRRAIRARWLGGGGWVRTVAERTMGGERLEVWALGRRTATPPAGRGGRPPPGIDGRRRTRADRPSGSSRGPARGRTSARGGA